MKNLLFALIASCLLCTQLNAYSGIANKPAKEYVISKDVGIPNVDVSFNDDTYTLVAIPYIELVVEDKDPNRLFIKQTKSFFANAYINKYRSRTHAVY